MAPTSDATMCDIFFSILWSRAAKKRSRLRYSLAILEALLLLEPKKICYVVKSLYFRKQV